MAPLPPGTLLETARPRSAKTELIRSRVSGRLRAIRFAPLQTVDHPKPGKFHDRDGKLAGCVYTHVLPSRFSIGLFQGLG